MAVSDRDFEILKEIVKNLAGHISNANGVNGPVLRAELCNIFRHRVSTHPNRRQILDQSLTAPALSADDQGLLNFAEQYGFRKPDLG